ncbi:hypothetical protein AVEN_239856-1 [Araneus ventricosus]|uniref:Secreted protein n=1 Tax=Araneus ventricosus TaxID=182803 RepID=A0A4Y2F862_ARAVE|nr:hypothetical protein AVEN_239856-1 [Araneus ventricosus]
MFVPSVILLFCTQQLALAQCLHPLGRLCRRGQINKYPSSYCSKRPTMASPKQHGPIIYILSPSATSCERNASYWSINSISVMDTDNRDYYSGIPILEIAWLHVENSAIEKFRYTS